MKISIFGMGYVGCVSAACLADAGFDIVGVDVSEEKLSLISKGKSPIVEPGMDELLSKQVAEGRFTVTSDVAKAIASSDVSMICVGTPSRKNGGLDLSYVEKVAEQIGEALRDRDSFHTVVVRSTMLPGSVFGTVVPALERSSGKSLGDTFSVSINPEFLREGTAIRDHHAPPFTLIGVEDERSRQALKILFGDIDAPFLETKIGEAEMVKYTCNCFHALKVSFANEIGSLCKVSGVDSHVVMDAFCKDDKLNLSSYYLKPGFAFGGSCLPKDLRALNQKARSHDINVPVLGAVLASNNEQIDMVFERIMAMGRKRISLLGLSFKPGTDDLRESPMVTLAEKLIGKGFELQIYDREVELARLLGANKSYIDSGIPHLSVLLNNSIEKTIEHAEVVVVCKQDAEYTTAINSNAEGKMIIDLVRLAGVDESMSGYDGISW